MPRSDIHPPGPDAWRWVELHGRKVLEEGPDSRVLIEFECRCTKLTADGRCGIYEERPLVCVLFAPGGPDCMDTVRRRRTPEQYERIREAGDPEVIHG
jgi:Fe-S-cluster containining protein